MIFRRTQGGSFLIENPKGGSVKILEGFRGGDHSNLLGQYQFESQKIINALIIMLL